MKRNNIKITKKKEKVIDKSINHDLMNPLMNSFFGSKDPIFITL